MSDDNGTAIRGRLVRPPAADGVKPPPRIFIGTPAFASMLTASYVAGLISLMRSLDASGLQHAMAMLGNESLITRARNRLVAEFLKTDCTHLLFIDADIGFSARDVKPMVEADLEVVCGAYPMKTIGWENVARAAAAGCAATELAVASARYAVNPTAAGANGAPIAGLQKAGAKFLEVQDAATGFLLIRRDVIERFIAHYRERIAYVADYEPCMGETHHMVFQADRDPVAVAAGMPARYLSEDYWFSRMWQLMGGQIWLCMTPRLTHTGMHTYVGSVGDLFMQDPPATAVASMPTADAVAAQ